jgi:trimethylamine--corrinoid protein Co-methyltransferase
MSIVQARLAVLDEEQIARIHGDSLRILASTGVRVDSPRARELLGRAAGPGAVDGSRVRIPAGLVDWALSVAARQVEVYDRRGQLAFRLPGEARFGIGVTCLYYQDPRDDRATPFTREHMAATVRLGQALPAYDCVSTVGIVQDVPAHISDLVATLEMTANTEKPLVVLISDEQAFVPALDLLEHLHGDLGRAPFVLPYLNPISPLVINSSTSDKMFAAAERGLPYIYSNYGMAGASTPITPAGTLVLLNAELLAGLVLSQLIKAGSHVILGSLPAYFDMKGIGSFYEPASYVVDLACAEMMAHYGLPHCGTSGSGMGWGPDLIAAGHQWTNHLLSCIGKVGLVPFVGDNLGALALSPAIIVYANDIIQQVRLLARGFELSDEAVGLDEIAQVGPGGDYLTTRRTLRLFRGAYYRSDLYTKLTLEDWQSRGSPDAGAVLRQRTAELLATAQAPADREEILARGNSFIASRVGRAS